MVAMMLICVGILSVASGGIAVGLHRSLAALTARLLARRPLPIAQVLRDGPVRIDGTVAPGEQGTLIGSGRREARRFGRGQRDRVRGDNPARRRGSEPARPRNRPSDPRVIPRIPRSRTRAFERRLPGVTGCVQLPTPRILLPLTSCLPAARRNPPDEPPLSKDDDYRCRRIDGRAIAELTGLVGTPAFEPPIR
jgi:hypothetical protein